MANMSPGAPARPPIRPVQICGATSLSHDEVSTSGGCRANTSSPVSSGNPAVRLRATSPHGLTMSYFVKTAREASACSGRFMMTSSSVCGVACMASTESSLVSALAKMLRNRVTTLGLNEVPRNLRFST